MPRYLAFDLGAGSGRAFLGTLRSGVLDVREVHRFTNEPIHCGSAMHWDAQKIWGEMRVALDAIDEPLSGIAVDTWGVDYALLDARGELLQNPFHYRDPRNASAMEAVLSRIPKDEIYRRTGTQFLPFNTLYQLYAAKRDFPELLSKAHQMVLMPDLFRYWMTGQAACEYTIASTTQFANPVTRAWDRDLLSDLDLPADLPAEIVEPATITGSLAGVPVIAPAAHDTGSAVAAIAARGNTAFLSSGTWSLLGIELDQPVVSAEALRLNFTNEGGVCGTTRLLKNVMGLWILEGCRRCWSATHHDELTEAATKAPAFRHLVDPDHATFLNPAAMPAAIDRFCQATAQHVPGGPASYVRAVLESLALKYRIVLRHLESLTGRNIDTIRVIGGGSKNRLLNQFTADATGATVVAGPAEATVLGNIGVQMLATGEAASLAEMRAIIDRAFPLETFVPRDSEPWNRQAERFRQYCENFETSHA